MSPTLRLVSAHLLLGGWLLVAGCDERSETPTELYPGVAFAEFRGLPLPLAAPVRLAVLPSGQLLVTDSRRRSVYALDPSGLAVEGGFEVGGKPLGIGARGGRIFVGNVTRRTVEVYDLKGRIRGHFGADAVGYPIDLAVDDAAALVFVLDAAALTVRVFDQNGRSLGSISGPGGGDALLQSPTGIAVDPARGEVLVSDYGPDGGSAAVKIFSYEGDFVDIISGAGRCGLLGCSGGFSRPQGLEVDGGGRVYVTDALLAQVMVFDRVTKQPIATLGGRGMGLRLPLDVALDRDGAVYVTSNRTGSVELVAVAGGVGP